MDMNTIGVVAALLLNVSALVLKKKREAEACENNH